MTSLNILSPKKFHTFYFVYVFLSGWNEFVSAWNPHSPFLTTLIWVVRPLNLGFLTRWSWGRMLWRLDQWKCGIALRMRSGHRQFSSVGLSKFYIRILYPLLGKGCSLDDFLMDLMWRSRYFAKVRRITWYLRTPVTVLIRHVCDFVYESRFE